MSQANDQPDGASAQAPNTVFDGLSLVQIGGMTKKNILSVVKQKNGIAEGSTDAVIRESLAKQVNNDQHDEATLAKWNALHDRLIAIDTSNKPKDINSTSTKADAQRDKAAKAKRSTEKSAGKQKTADEVEKDEGKAAKAAAKTFLEAVGKDDDADGNAYFNVIDGLRTTVEQAKNTVLPDRVEFFGPDRNPDHKRLSNGTLGNNDNMIVAIRCNENYTDTEAMHTGERSYVRRGAMKARHIVMYQCRKKNAVMLMWGFEANDITVSGQTSSETAAQRTIFISAAATLGNKTPISLKIPRERTACRVYAPVNALNKLHSWVKEEHCVSIKNVPTYLGGQDFKCVTMFLNNNEIHQVQGYGGLVEKMEHIVSSAAKKRQFILRRSGVTSLDTYRKAIELQKMFPGCLTRLTGPESIRCTLKNDFDQETNKKIRSKMAGWMVYEDAPLNVFTHTRMKDQEGTQEAPSGRVKAKISVAGPAHVEEVKAITKHFNGVQMQALANKFTDLPTGFVIHLPITFNFNKYEGVPISPEGSLATYFIERMVPQTA